MKLKNLIITGILLTTMIFTGCDGKSETAKVKSPEIQAAWDDIFGEESDEQSDGELDEDKDDTENEDEESDSKNETVTDVSLPDEVDDSWYIDNGNAITEGIFTVGKDVKAGSYNITNPDEDDWLYIYVF